MGLAAAAALSASAAVCVVALAFALYALVEPYVDRAGGAAVVAGAAALIIGVAGLSIGASARRARAVEAPGSAVERLLRLVREKPVVAISAALGAGFMAVRNPRYLGAAIRAFLEGRGSRRR